MITEFFKSIIKPLFTTFTFVVRHINIYSIYKIYYKLQLITYWFYGAFQKSYFYYSTNNNQQDINNNVQATLYVYVQFYSVGNYLYITDIAESTSCVRPVLQQLFIALHIMGWAPSSTAVQSANDNHIASVIYQRVSISTAKCTLQPYMWLVFLTHSLSILY